MVVRGSASDAVWEGSETKRFPTHQTLDLNEAHPHEGRASDIPGSATATPIAASTCI